ncbi:LLM class flavin-dependent oxidoreductase [Nocardia asteroides]
MTLRYGVYLPPFGELSDPRILAELAAEAESSGFDGVFREVAVPRDRARLLDEALDVLTALWSGEVVHHDGPAYHVDGLRFLPRPVQRPRIPVWVAAQSLRQAPLRRAARFDGLCPEADPDQLVEMLAVVAENRGDLTGFEVAVAASTDRDHDAYARAGATWWLTELPMSCSRAEALATIRRGPHS